MSPSTRRILLGLWITCLSLSGCMPARVQCAIDEDCARGEVCDAELQCVAAAQKCEGDDACPGSYCVRGGCSDKPACVVDGDCAGGYICEEHVCAPAECTADAACKGQLCSRGRCTDSCQSDGDCADGKLCQSGACNAACTSSEVCEAGLVCREGRCQHECDSSDDCEGAQACVKNRCVDAECRRGTDCALSQSCVDFSCEDNEACAGDEDCGSDERCGEGYCRAPECGEASPCATGYGCEAWRCALILPEGGSFSVPEEGSQEISLPPGATVNDPGVVASGAASVVDGAILFTPSGCAPTTEVLQSHIRLVDGSVSLMTSTVAVVDPGPPEAPVLQLSDQPAARQIALSFPLPPENPSGSRCRPTRYEVEWGPEGGATQTREAEVGELALGQTIEEALPLAGGSRAAVRVRVFDEQGQAGEAEAALDITRAVVTRFSLSANDRAPTDAVEVNWTVEGAGRVQILRDGDVVYEGASESGSERFPVGARASAFSLRYWDTLGNGFSHPDSLQLRIVGVLEVEANDSIAQATELSSEGAGRAVPGNADYWRVRQPNPGGYVLAVSQQIAEACRSDIQIELLDSSGAVLGTTQGSCPTVNGNQAYNLPAGDYYLRVTPTGEAVDYALRFRAVAASCGNGWPESLAGEECDGDGFCTDSCLTEETIVGGEETYPSHRWASLRTEQRMKLVLAVGGWVDVGSGDYQNNTCGARNSIRLEDAQMSPLSEQRKVSAPDGCERIIQRLSAGTYYVRFRAEGTGRVRLNYAVHNSGSCGDGVVDPTAMEICDQGNAGGDRSGWCADDCFGFYPGRGDGSVGNTSKTWVTYSESSPVYLSCTTSAEYSSIRIEVYNLSGAYIHNQTIVCDNHNLPSTENIRFRLHVPGGFRVAAQALGMHTQGNIVLTPAELGFARALALESQSG